MAERQTHSSPSDNFAIVPSSFPSLTRLSFSFNGYAYLYIYLQEKKNKNKQTKSKTCDHIESTILFIWTHMGTILCSIS